MSQQPYDIVNAGDIVLIVRSEIRQGVVLYLFLEILIQIDDQYALRADIGFARRQ